MTELTEAQQIVMDKQKKEYDIKFKTWAIDRAIEILKSHPAAPVEIVLEYADKLCAWITQSPKKFAVPTEDEAATIVEQMKAEGEI